MRGGINWSWVCSEVHSNSATTGPQGCRARGRHDVQTTSPTACSALRRVSVRQRDVPHHRNVRYSNRFDIYRLPWVTILIAHYCRNYSMDSLRCACRLYTNQYRNEKLLYILIYRIQLNNMPDLSPPKLHRMATIWFGIATLIANILVTIQR